MAWFLCRNSTKSAIEHARKTVQRIQDAGIYILDAVINDIDFEGKDSYYYSYYYYQNRYYASYYSNEKKLGIRRIEAAKDGELVQDGKASKDDAPSKA